jgi:asparagine synthetase B (glutamine-hydrolysing)
VDDFLEPQRGAGTADALDRCLHHDLQSYLPGLLQMGDRASMAVSIESRTPLLDYRIAEFLARVPAEQKVRGRVPKFLLREVGRPQLPAEIVDRRDEIPLPWPLDEWLGVRLAEPVRRILGSRPCAAARSWPRGRSRGTASGSGAAGPRSASSRGSASSSTAS